MCKQMHNTWALVAGVDAASVCLADPGCCCCTTHSTWKTYRISKGAKFATQRKKQATELTSEMIARCAGGHGT
jgi:hypothetical protein